MDDESRSPGSADMAATPLSDADFRSYIMQKIQAAVVVHGPDTRIVACNPKSCELLGLTEEQMLGRDARHPDWQLVREDGTRLTPEDYPVHQVMATRQPLRDLSLGICRPNLHDVVWVLVSADPVLGQDGGIRQVIVTFTDITDRKKAEDQVVREHRELLQVLDSVNAQIWYMNTEGRVVGCNRVAKMISGATPEQAYGGTIHTLAPGWDDLDRRHQESLTVARTGMPLIGSIEAFRLGSEVRWAKVDKVPWRDANGDIVGILMLIYDITDLKRTEEVLRESEEQFHTIFDSMNDAIFVHDSETGAILDVNERTCEMCACSRAEVCALTVGEISLGTPPYDQAHALEYMRKAAAGEPQRFDWHCRARNGRLFWSEVTVHRVRIGSQDRVLVVVRDISDRKRAEEERDRLNRALEAKNAELESLIYSASHDLRSPLVNVHGFAGSLSDSIAEIRLILAGAQVSDGVRGRLSSILDRDIPEALEFISSGAAKMDSLLDGLLQLSRLGRMALDARPLDMNHLMSEVTLAVAFQIQQAGAVVEVEPLPACLGDKGQINQVFSNLLGNALKYLDPSRPGAVRISGRIEKDKVVYCVQDNGIGIPAEHQSRVFEVFYRGGGSSEDGEGLGLSIVRKIVDRHHGEVRVESEVGKGSRFYVSLPTAPENGSLAP